MTVRVLHGDCRDVLKTLADQSVQCVVTSPPYFGLRDYGVDGQIGLEPTPDAFVAEMVTVFREVWRVLRDDGVCWLNLGDSYAGSRCGPQGDLGEMADRSIASQREMRAADGSHQARLGAKPKNLIGIPWRVAFALQNDGWYLRRDVIWSKPNPMPESCTDRPTTAHEYLFLLTKRARYFYDAEAVREGRTGDEDAREFRGGCYVGGDTDNDTMGKRKVVGNKRLSRERGRPNGAATSEKFGHNTSCGTAENGSRNLRSVWTIATAPFSEAHFATFPPKLAETCILAGTSEMGACPACGAPWARTITKGEPDADHRAACGADAAGGYSGQSTKNHDAAGVQNASDVKRRILDGLRKKTYGWQPTCDCPAADPVSCVVLDPFGGAGTTGLVADRLQRDAVLIELNPKYVDIINRRVTKDAGLFAEIIEAPVPQPPEDARLVDLFAEPGIV